MDADGLVNFGTMHTYIQVYVPGIKDILRVGFLGGFW